MQFQIQPVYTEAKTTMPKLTTITFHSKKYNLHSNSQLFFFHISHRDNCNPKTILNLAAIMLFFHSY